MPLEKARALYGPLYGDALVSEDSDAIVVGLRRRVVARDSIRVEFLLLTLDDCHGVLAPLLEQGVELAVICSLHLFHRQNRFVPWLATSQCPATRVAVLIDDDPI